MSPEKTNLGYEIKTTHYTVFFGGIESQIGALKIAYPNIDFVRLKQIHSDAVVESNNTALDYQVHGDAHFTKAAGLGLCVITADCVPVFFCDRTSGTVAGIHAGWRGVASRIIPKTMAALVKNGVKPDNIEAFIGPHIQRASFEVGKDVRDQILTSIGLAATGPGNEFFENISAGKAIVDLNQIVKYQLQTLGVMANSVYDLHLDTYTNISFHSHRRDKDKAGRQISFIVRN